MKSSISSTAQRLIGEGVQSLDENLLTVARTTTERSIGGSTMTPCPSSIYVSSLFPAFWLRSSFSFSLKCTPSLSRRPHSKNGRTTISGLAETPGGIVTVRAFSAERRFIGNLVQRVDLSTNVCVFVHFRS